MSLSEHVNLVITRDSVGITRAGFGTILILSHNAAWVERTRTYAGIAEVAEDWAVTSPEYRAANAVFSQNPKPRQLKIGRAALKPTLKYTCGVRTLTNAETYNVRVAGQGVTETTTDYTSDSTAAAEEVHFGVVSDLNAVTGKNYTATYAALVYADAVFTADNTTEIFTIAAHGFKTGDGPFQVSNSGGALPAGLTAVTDYWVIKIDANTFYLATTLALAMAGTHLSISDNGTGTQTLSDTPSTVSPFLPFAVTGNAAGNWFSLEFLKPALWDVSQTHADPGVATDLGAILVDDEDFYGVITLYNSDAVMKATASWVESNKKMYFAGSSETIAINVASDGTQGTFDDLKTLAYERTGTFYHPAPDQFFDAAIMGRYFATEPGFSQVAYRRLNGVASTKLTSTQRTNLDNRNASYYKTEGGINITWKGKRVDGDFIDVTRDLDWVYDDMQKGVFGGLAGQEKVPYSNAGRSFVMGKVRASIQRAIQRGIFLDDTANSDDPTPTVECPFVEDIDSSEKLARNLPDVKWRALLAGSILTVDITGVVTQ